MGSKPINTPGVWCCAEKHKCKWQGFVLNNGLAWGVMLPLTDPWRQWHDRECGGRLIQLIDPLPGARQGAAEMKGE